MTPPAGSTPNLFLIGAPKCATTSLATALVADPSVSYGASKEPGIFGNQDYDVAQRADLLTQHYRRAQTARWRLDATPWLLYDPGAYERIVESHGADGGQELVFLASLREPMSRVRSMYKDQVRRGAESSSFSDAVRQSLRAPTHGPLTRQYVRTSSYAPFIDQWVDALGDTTPLRVTFFDQVTEQPTLVLSALERLLDIDLGELPTDNTAESTTAAGTAVVDRLVRVGNRLPTGLRSNVRRVGVPLAAKLLAHAPRRRQADVDTSIDDQGLLDDVSALFDTQIKELAAAIERVEVIGERPAWARIS